MAKQVVRWGRKATVLEGILLVIGCFIMSLGLHVFLIPNKIDTGGVSGLSTILYYLYQLPVGIGMLLLNVPLFLLSYRFLGRSAVVKSFFGSVLLSVMVDLEAVYWPHMALSLDGMLAAIYGGIIVGAGLGLVFRSKYTTGGTDLLALLIHTYTRYSSGMILLVIDGIIILLAGWVFNVEHALYGLIGAYATSRVMDLVQEGVSYTKAVLIISDRYEELSRVLPTYMNRGVTAFPSRGIYTGTEREALLCVVAQSEVSQLKKEIYTIDAKAFVIIANASEVLGEGFALVKHEIKENPIKEN